MSFDSSINGSSTASVCVFIVVVVPFTVKSPAIVTSAPVVKSPSLLIVNAVVSSAFAFDTLNTIDWVIAAWSIFNWPIKFWIKLVPPDACWIRKSVQLPKSN